MGHHFRRLTNRDLGGVRPLATAVWILCGASLACVSHAQPPPPAIALPSEAELPRADAGPTPRLGELPDESVSARDWLSRSEAATSRLTQGLADDRPALAAPGSAPPANAPLPDESMLPASPAPAAAVTVADVDTNAAARPADSDVSPGETRPFLRLNYDGHTERVRALGLSRDGQWAVSGGEDKVLHVWQRLADRGWIHRRLIRWPVERGQLGRIYRVAARDHLAAFAGHGASGGIGEIWIVDITSGDLQRALVDPRTAHRQTIAHLSWAPGDASVLLSADVEGRVVAWRPDPATGLWSGRILVDRDAVTYGAATAAALRPLRTFVSAAFVGAELVVVPKFVGVSPAPNRAPVWRLELITIDAQQRTTVDQSDQSRLVVTLAGSPDGRRIAAADAAGKLRVWELATLATGTPAANATPPSGTIRRVTELPSPAVTGQPLDLNFDETGLRLAVGYAGGAAATANVNASSADAAASPSGGGVELWDFRDEAMPRMSGGLRTPSSVIAARIRGAGDELLLATRNELRVHSIDAQGIPSAEFTQQLTTPVRPIRQVAFVDRPEGYEIAIGFGDQWEHSFDLSRIEIGRAATIDVTKLRQPQTGEPRWTIRPEPTPAGERYRLYFGDQPRARLPLEPQSHGTPSSIAVLSATGVEGQAADTRTALAIGSSMRNNIYIYEAPLQASDEPPKLLRQFRVHSGTANSLSVSTDLRYLASGSEDATVAIWPLGGLWGATRLESMWGLELEATPRGLEVSRIREDGPLFFRGVREGDTLASLRATDPQNPNVIVERTEPEEMRAALEAVAFDTLVVFQWQRRGGNLPAFQSFPAYQPLAQLLIDQDREWAIWTPAGIYDASVNGHRHFGWQVNRGIDRLPDFFRADQFRERLERPEVLRRLLQRGSLAGALAMGGGVGAPVGEEPIATQLQARPRIEWLSPPADGIATGDHVEIEAKIRLPLGVRSARSKVFADGLTATTTTLLGTELEGGQWVEHLRWSVPLANSPQIQVEIVATTQADSWDRLTRVIQRRVEPPDPSHKPRLHLIAVGVGDYRDPQIQPLDFAARGATELFNVITDRSAPMYRVEGTRLLDQDAIRPLWNVYAAEAAASLASEVRGDDLVVIYLCGHGVRDPATGRWHFVTADARHSDLMNDRYTDCLSLDDLAGFAQLPCRKLAILDSCHSGAIQPVMHTGDLKSMLRQLQDDRILTLTASEGHEEAAEDRDARLGRFTARLIEALAGTADGVSEIATRQPDGIVTLDEVIAYVRQTLAADSLKDGFIQRPTAGPSDLLRTIHLPLTATGIKN